MFIDAVVNHVKFGKGVITDLNVNPESFIKSNVIVKFDSGKISKFTIKAFASNGFFETDDDNIAPFVDDLIKKEDIAKQEKLKECVDALNYIPQHPYDEYENKVTKNAWIEAASVAGEYRFQSESRAVVMDGELVFINATAAIKYCKSKVKDCNRLYKACESNSKYIDHKWSYAEKETIESIIARFDESNDIERTKETV